MSANVTGAPGVLAIVVAHDGATWLPATLAALAAQTYPHLVVVAVDNASEDGSRDLLLDRLGEDRVLLADRDLGFGAAVSMALDAVASHGAEHVLFVHDDLALAPDAVANLVAALEADPRLAVVGPKLRVWDRPDELQSVGWTIDLTGRADTGVDPDELDQGQRDQERRTLYVSTGGMLVRRDVFDAVGRFDRRYHLFRDDLDLCWRIWLAGHDIEVVPDAVGAHAAAAANYVRLGQTRFIGPRYFAERNTLATLLKNYGLLRLVWVLPLYVVVGIAKMLGFLLTRRVSDAWQTLRAWAWNLVHLPETRRLRRAVQDGRVRSDRELAPLFGRVGPRVRAYAEAMAAWIAGGDADPAPEPSDRPRAQPEPAGAITRVAALVGRRPSLIAGAVLTVLLVIGSVPLLAPGQLRGGWFAAWPASPLAFLADYAAGWHEAGTFGTAQAPSPAQALLGLWQGLFLGNAYVASRSLLLLPVLVGFVLALRAAQTASRRRAPRVAAAVAYALSPPVLAALLTGELGALVVAGLLPGIVAAGITMGRRRVQPASAWRAVAAVTLLTAVAGAFEPLVVVAVVVASILAAATLVAVTSDTAWRLAVVARFGLAAAGPLILLLPWSLDLLGPAGPLAGVAAAGPVGGELWRWLLLAPPLLGFPGLAAGAGFVLAGLLGLVLGVRRRPLVVAALWFVALTGAVSGWWLDRSLAVTWGGLPLLATAAAYAGLLALAFTTGEAQLARHAFGWRQLAVLGTGVAVTASLVLVAVGVVRGDRSTYQVGAPTLPSFVTAEAAEVGPFRVLVVASDGDTAWWDVVDHDGPSMAATGVPVATAAYDLAGVAVDDILGEGDPGASDRLGLLNIRYVYVPPGVEDVALDVALTSQVNLEPRPLAAGRLLQVTGWLPRVATVPGPVATRLDAGRGLPEDAAIGSLGLRQGGTAMGRVAEPGAVLVAELNDGQWQLTSGGALQAAEPGDLVRFTDLEPGRAELRHLATTARGLAVTGQLLAVLLAISLALRPPDFARRLAAADPRRRDDEDDTDLDVRGAHAVAPVNDGEVAP